MQPTTKPPALYAPAPHVVLMPPRQAAPGGHGSAGAIIIAGSGLPPRSARGRPGDDITGDKSVRDLIAKTKGNYF